MAKTKFMNKIKFDEHLPELVLFNDYFVKLFNMKMEIAVCPNIMSNVRDEATRSLSREEGLPLIQKRFLVTVKAPDGVMHTFTCKEAKLNNFIRKGFIDSPCFNQVCFNSSDYNISMKLSEYWE